MYKLLVVVAPLLFVGCSNKAVYDNIQFNNRKECNKVPPSQYEECIDRSSKSYEEYGRERKEVIGK
jgi:hypothetical protein